MKRQIEYSPTDNLVYFISRNGDTKYPIAVFVGGELKLFTKFKFTNEVNTLCTRAYVHGKRQTFNDEDVARSTEIEIMGMLNLGAKRVCYFANKVYKTIKITKVSNVARSSTPASVQDELLIDNASLKLEFVNAINALIQSPVLRKSSRFGTYLPSKFVQMLTKSTSSVYVPVPTMKKPDSSSQEITYTIACDGDISKIAELTLLKQIGGSIIEKVCLGGVHDYSIIPANAFKDKARKLVDCLTSVLGQKSTINFELGEELWRAYEASKIDGGIDKPKTTSTNYWMELSDTSAGPEIVIVKYEGDKFVSQDWVGSVDNGVVTIYDEFVAAEKIIRGNFARMGNETRYHMSFIDGDFVWKIHENLEKEIKKSTKTSKPTPVAADIDSEAEKEHGVALVAIGTVPSIAVAKTITSPLNINTKTILI